MFNAQHTSTAGRESNDVIQPPNTCFDESFVEYKCGAKDQLSIGSKIHNLHIFR